MTFGHSFALASTIVVYVCSMYEQSSHNVPIHGVLKMDGWGRGAENNMQKELPSTFMNAEFLRRALSVDRC